MRLCLVEDKAVGDLEPLTLTRPVFDLRLGASTLGQKLCRAFGGREGGLGAVVRAHLVALLAEQHPGLAVNDRAWLARGPALVANGRWVPPADLAPPEDEGPWVGLCDGRPACALVGPDQAIALEATASETWGVDAWFGRAAAEARCVELGGEWIARPWDLVTRNGVHLERDFAAGGRPGDEPRQAGTFALVGPADRLAIHPTARIDPYTVLDTTNGPITIDAGAVVQPFTRLEGPCYIGPRTQLFRANIRGGTTIGPECRIGGEVEASVVQGYTNKYHEGFLGHAYVGAWVNLGAITSNSDLRNDYGEVRVPLQGDPIATGQAKVGCFVGDHTRTGLGSMLNTGTSLGVMCNVLPAGPLLPKHVPSFAAVLYGRVAPGFGLDRLLETARIVKGRRGQGFSAVEERLYRELFERTRLERERAFQKIGDRREDRWAVAATGR